MTRINCHSAFKHYEMFHSGGCGGGNYGSIFNTTYNINCGGSHGGFWSGFGFGLGNAFGGLFSGIFGGGMFGMGNMFGGGMFGMGNMFGGGGLFGGNMFGLDNMFGGGGWGNFWGSSNRTNNTGNSTTSNGCTCGCKDKATTGVTDKDNALIEDFEKKVKKYEDIATPSAKDKEEAKALYEDIKEKCDKPEDDVYKNQNKLAYQKLLDKLKVKFPDIDTAGSAAGSGTGSAAGSGAGAGAVQGTAGAGQGVTGAGQNEDTIQIGGKNRKISELNPQEIRGLTKDQIKKLKPQQATQLLKTLGIEPDGKIKASDLIDRTVIRLLSLSGINVKLAENKNDDGTITDNFIWGKIELDEDQDDESKPISYNVNCNNDKSSQKNTYTFTQTEKGKKEFTVKFIKPGSNAKLADNAQQTVKYKVEAGEEYLTRNGKKYTTTH